MSRADAPLFLTDAHAQRLLDWPDVIACLAAAYAAFEDRASAPPRTMARRDGGWLRSMAAIPGGRLMGAKTIAKGVPRGVSYLIALWNRDDAELVALLDGRTITAMRTAGTSAVAVDRLAPRSPLRLAVLGSSHEARAHAAAMAAVRPVESLAVFSPTPANRERFAADFAARHGVASRASASARDAVAGANLVVCAARSHDESPILDGTWLAPGAMVVSIGSTIREQHEVDVETVRRANHIVADVPDEVARDTGDMIDATRAGVDFSGKLVSLAQVLQGRCATAPRAGDIVLFKSVGSGLQDIAVAAMCYEKALACGAGVALPANIVVKGAERK